MKKGRARGSSRRTASLTGPSSGVSPAVDRMEVFVVDPQWRKKLVFVRLEAKGGVVGWGEAYTQYDRDAAIAATLQELSRYLVGRPVHSIRNFLHIAFDDFAQGRGSLELYSALSAIEQAMWDVVGKLANQPVYNLLGGPVRDKLRFYANGWSYGLTRPAEYANAAEKVIKRGFDALKFDPLPKPCAQ